MKNLNEVRGRIFNIQRFSIHDGPGVRTIVFLKGCSMRCRWCCNPESQEWSIQTMKSEGKEKTVGRDVTVGEVMDEVERDRIYYYRSGGGMTLSGGECLMQPDFAEALLAEAHERGINTAIETAGYVPRENIERALPYIDTVLMDIKHMDSEKHKAFTTRENSLILGNAKYIAQNAKQMIVRVPVVPKFNDTEKEISDIADFVKSIGVKEMELLPYHRIGTDKYAGLGRTYTMPDILPPEKEKMTRLNQILQSKGLGVKLWKNKE